MGGGPGGPGGGFEFTDPQEMFKSFFSGEGRALLMSLLTVCFRPDTPVVLGEFFVLGKFFTESSVTKRTNSLY